MSKIRWTRSLRYRFTAVMLAASIGFGFAVVGITRAQITEALLSRASGAAQEVMERHAWILADHVRNRRLGLLERDVEQLLDSQPRWSSILVRDAGGRVVVEVGEPTRADTWQVAVALGEMDEGTLEVGIQVDKDRLVANQVVRDVAIAMFLLTIAGNAVALILGLWLTRPLEDMSARAMQIGQGRTDVRFAVPAVDDELAQLARTLNETFDQLDAARAQLVVRNRDLVELEKLAAVGRLAAGVAHEVANPIAGVTGCVRRLSRSDLSAARRERYAALAIEGLTRAGEVLRSMLAYANPGMSGLEQCDARDLVRRVCDLVEAGTKVTVTLVPGPQIHVEWPKGQVEMVLTNLILNASQAASSEVVVSCEERRDTVTIEIRDDGPGIPEEIIDRVFEPFFTTREPGKGTGLGLAVSLAVARAFGGWIDLQRRTDGPGTVAQLRIPQQPTVRISDVP